jgi:diguanylate cyclase (GGDEF)-like protein
MLGGAVNPPGVLLLASAMVTFIIAVQTSRLQPFAGRSAMAATLYSAAAWSFAAAMDTMPFSQGAKVVWAGLAWIPITALPGFLLVFAWHYVKGEVRPVPLIWQIPHWAMITLTTAVALTNPWHHLMYEATKPLHIDGPTGYVHGPWFFVSVTYGYVLMLLSFATVIEAIPDAQPGQRRQYIGIAVAMVLPWIANLCNTADLFHPFGVDPTPISFLVTGFIVFFMLRGGRVLNLLPVARSVLVEAIPDPVLVLDLGHQVVDANAATFSMIGVAEQVIGRPLVEIAALGPLHGIAQGEGPPIEVTLGQDRQFEVTMVPLDHAGRQVGQLLMLRDITRRARLEIRLREQATRDSLTGLHNRRTLEEVGRRLTVESDARGQPLSVIMVDLDYFKRLNDHHGHQAGDRVLATIGRFLSDRVRQTDFVFRTGGEEILILLPGAAATQALARIDGWRREFAALEISVGHIRVQSTFSAGVAVYPQDGATLEEVMAHADKALYQAKEQGRNRACLWLEAQEVQYE